MYPRVQFANPREKSAGGRGTFLSSGELKRFELGFFLLFYSGHVPVIFFHCYRVLWGQVEKDVWQQLQNGKPSTAVSASAQQVTLDDGPLQSKLKLLRPLSLIPAQAYTRLTDVTLTKVPTTDDEPACWPSSYRKANHKLVFGSLNVPVGRSVAQYNSRSPSFFFPGGLCCSRFDTQSLPAWPFQPRMPLQCLVFGDSGA